MLLPDLVTGACPAGYVPVYRLWNQRADSNHRYTTDPGIKAYMQSKDYVAEGYGPDAVAMCTTQPLLVDALVPTSGTIGVRTRLPGRPERRHRVCQRGSRAVDRRQSREPRTT